MSSKFFEFLVIELSDFGLVPGSEESFVGGGEVAFAVILKAGSSEGIGDLDLIGDSFFGSVVLCID